MSYPRLDPTAVCTAASDGGHAMATNDDGEWSCLACGETAEDLADAHDDDHNIRAAANGL